jgi:DNA-binding CsgD family transcriptional regulator
MKTRKNDDIREMAVSQGIRLWEIADGLGITDGNFSRLLRHELPNDKRVQIFDIIEQLGKR